MSGSALVIVDCQNDFVLDDGALPVPGAFAAVKSAVSLAAFCNTIVATRDWHPIDHISFKEWGPHCVQGTLGAELVPVVEKIATVIVNKGNKVAQDSYSGFGNPALEKILESFDHVIITGVATDYCVFRTAIDAKAKLPNSTITVDLKSCRGINPETTAFAIEKMGEVGISCVGG